MYERGRDTCSSPRTRQNAKQKFRKSISDFNKFFFDAVSTKQRFLFHARVQSRLARFTRQIPHIRFHFSSPGLSFPFAPNF